jgi:hypothetical protein
MQGDKAAHEGLGSPPIQDRHRHNHRVLGLKYLTAPGARHRAVARRTGAAGLREPASSQTASRLVAGDTLNDLFYVSDLQHPFTHSISRDPKRAQRPTGVAVGIGEQAEQLMLGPDMGMPELTGRRLRVANNLAGGLCEPFEHERQASHHRTDSPAAQPPSVSRSCERLDRGSSRPGWDAVAASADRSHHIPRQAQRVPQLQVRGESARALPSLRVRAPSWV